MRQRTLRISLMVSASVIATIAMPAFAQEATPPAPAEAASPDTTTDDIVVTGVRASIRSAQAIKRNATAVVDSIVAEDIGKLPDNTVSDALQRVTGIQVSRSAGEVGTVLVRGLPDIETLINGREAFTGTGRGVALQDIPAELVAGVDVYKTNLPEQIEGSVSGTIDIRLRRPFDFSGLTIAGGARGIYSDQRKKGSYIASGLVSDRWQTGIGEMGLLLGVSYNKRKYEDQTAFNFGFNRLSAADPTRVPDTVGGLVTDGDRSRPSINASFQWKPTPDLEIYADGIFTGYRQDYDVDFFVGLPKAGAVTVNSRQPTGTVSALNPPVARTITTINDFTISSKQTFHQKTDGYQANAGARYTAGRAVLSGEITYNKSSVTSRQYVVDTAYVVPRIDYNFDNNGTPNVNFNGYDFTNQKNLNFLTLFDNYNVAKSEQYAAHGDLLYTFDDGFLKNFKVGARYAKRTGSSAGTNPQGYGIPFVSINAYPGAGTNAPSGIIDGALGVDGFALADSGWIRDNIDVLRGLAGRPAGTPAFDPAQSFRLTENVYAAYGQVAFGSDGRLPFDGLIGMRIVNTATNLSVGPSTSPVNGKRNTLDLLPSLSLKFRPVSDVVLRFVAGRAILRPQFAALNPATSLTASGQTGGSGTFGTGSGGNPNLQNVRSWNFDATAEWYFSNTGSITVSGFYKKLDGYIQVYGATEFFTDTSGTSRSYLVTRPRNTSGGILQGVEVAATAFADFLPGALSGFGAQVSGTLSKGQVDDPINIGQRQDILPVSRYSYNLIGIYEKYGLSARLAYNWRSSYTDSYSAAFADGLVRAKAIGFLDLSVSYAVNNAITLTFDATNLTKTTYHDNFGTTSYLPRDTRQYDRTFGGGVRFKF
jgi:iron complex outermembrane receptor protein